MTKLIYSYVSMFAVMGFITSTFAEPLSVTATSNSSSVLEHIKADPKLGPLWQCFEDGMGIARDEISAKAGNEKRYFIYVVTLGNYMTIGDNVRVKCDQAYAGELVNGKMAEGPQKINDLFVAVLLAEDGKFFDECKAKTAEDWAGVKALCARAENSYKKRLHLP